MTTKNAAFDEPAKQLTNLEIVPTPTKPFLTDREVAERQGRSVKTLQNQRVTGDGIPFVKFGRSVRYRLSDVEAWEQARVRNSTSDNGGGR